MTINEPIVMVIFDGNVKEKVKKDSHVYMTSFEPISRETWAFVRVNKLEQKDIQPIEKAIEKDFKRFGKIKSVKYHPIGVEIVQMNPKQNN